jgi:hypothetical protein
MNVIEIATEWLKRRARPHTRIFVLNHLIDMPTVYATKPFEGGSDADLYLFDYDYIDQSKSSGCLSRLAEARAENGLDFSTKTLLLAARGLHPIGDGLIALLREFREHHMFFELWNGLNEVVELAYARIENLYLFPVTNRLQQSSKRRVPSSPNRRVFVSLGGDDDLDLIRAVISQCPELHFSVPTVSWQKPGSEKRFFDVQIPAANVTAVDCSAVRHNQQLSFSAEYRSAYDACDTVLIATLPDKIFQMRGGVRVADALHAGRHIVVTENPQCQLVMAQHEKTCLVAEHAAESVAANLMRICQGAFQVDETVYEEVRRLTVKENKLHWMIEAGEQPEAARRSVFARDSDLLATIRGSLLPHGQSVLEREIQGFLGNRSKRTSVDPSQGRNGSRSTR